MRTFDTAPEMTSPAETGCRHCGWSRSSCGGYIRALYAEVRRIIVTPDVSERLVKLGMQNSPEELSAYLKGNLAKWTKVVREAGIKAE